MGNSESNDGFVKEELARLVTKYTEKRKQTLRTRGSGAMWGVLDELIAELDAWSKEYDAE